MSEFKRATTPYEDTETFEADIQENKDGLRPFGVSYLDDSVVGMLKDDLVLLAGRSGGGKTELAMHIALECARRGIHVHYFALEAHKKELGFRLLYKEATRLYFQDRAHSKRLDYSKGPYISYDRWRKGQLDFLHKYAREARDKLKQNDLLTTRYSAGGYTLSKFRQDFLSIKGNAGLVLLDHLHYFELEDDRENSEYKKIVTDIRQKILEHHIPMILVSHIRKADRQRPQLVPEQEDFHGSSDIVKIATMAITIAAGGDRPRVYESMTQDGPIYSSIDIPRGFPSFMKIAKYRGNGSMEAHTALLQFNPETNTYGSRYYIGRAQEIDRKLCFLAHTNDSIPEWAVSAIDPKPKTVPTTMRSDHEC